MATQSSLAYKHWLRILRLWPTDPVRPQTVSFQHIMRQRLSKTHPSPSPSPSDSPTTSASLAADSVKANDALVTAVPPPSSNPPSTTSTPSWDESHQLRQVNALYSLLENRYATENPFPQNLRRPISDPEYYDVLVRELEEAPKRSWLAGLVKRIKGSLRFS
ncbi:hypothetical protein GJ744_002635 [Endocarpon pusillum]|uniref:Uncharacterized protein n=1 Tax=Endocarpon pusillum TaxID=364733 RepID=A0A8H7ABP6_9EURO|nr:hypothetical protein GJ744_002635 [Endocarpon pusillum]